MAQAKSRTASRGGDAIALLTADHAAVKKMFKAYEKLVDGEGDEEQKGELAASICEALTIHAAIEEEIFYPAVRAAIEDDDLMDEADVEHAEAKELIAQLEAAEPGDDHYDAKVTVLGENIDHHVKEEESEMFPKAKKAKLDLAGLGARMQERKEQLGAGTPPPPAKRGEGAAKRS
jgi:hemerythrin-like domain-containing protein